MAAVAFLIARIVNGKTKIFERCAFKLMLVAFHNNAPKLIFKSNIFYDIVDYKISCNKSPYNGWIK